MIWTFLGPFQISYSAERVENNPTLKHAQCLEAEVVIQSQLRALTVALII